MSAVLGCAAARLCQAYVSPRKDPRCLHVGRAEFYALDSASILSMSAKENLMPRPRWCAWILPDRRHLRSVIGVSFQRCESSAGVRNVGAFVSL